ncbi:MAG: hypothetical protein HWD59_13050 [Coxiellaceae bacterium]|nr:MAG: hypothetical protein HWD59_13050 [Coxiellaceae bacterium]
MPFEKTLDLSQQTKPNLSDAEFTSIMQELKTDTTVTTLILSGMHFKQKRSEQLRDMLKENKTIEILDLSHCQTGYYCLDFLQRVLKHTSI